MNSSRRKGALFSGPGVANGSRRVSIIGLMISGLFGALFVRLWYLQVIQAPTGSLAAFSNTVRVVESPSPRGLILARNGQPLVGNKTVMAVTLNRQTVSRDPWVVSRVAKLLGLTVVQVNASLNNPQYSPYAPVPIKVDVPLQTVILLGEHQHSYPGVAVQLQSIREYPHGSLAAHELGYVGQINAAQLAKLAPKGYQPSDQIGEGGVEYVYESSLRGTPGQSKILVDATGKVVRVISRTPGQPGDSVVLALDMGVQRAADNALAKEVGALRKKGFPATGGATVVLDPNNGQVLAMASYPTYNPSVWSGGISSTNYAALTSPASNFPLLNRAIEGLYTPGSTFKLVTATTALQDGVVSPSTLIDDSTGAFHVPGCYVGKCYFRDLAESHPAGPINVTYALSASNDIFFYSLGYQFWMDWINQHLYGANAIQDMANRFGLGDPNGTGIDLPGELGGAVDSLPIRQFNHQHYPKAFPYPPTWYAGDNIEMAFGQGGTVITPLELAVAYATFANGGTRYVPQVALGIVSPQGKVKKRFQPQVADRIAISPANWTAMADGFQGAVTQPYGTAYNTFLGFPFNKLSVAGKTGTASTNNQQPNSLFVAFAPVTHARYVVATVISQAGFGATGAAVATRQVLQYLADHPVPPSQLP